MLPAVLFQTSVVACGHEGAITDLYIR